MRRFLRENGLSIALFALFLLSLGGQSIAGRRTFNEDRKEHGQPPVRYVAYLVSGHFVESVFENWESEFLQMAAFVVMTIFLRQKGSSESKPLRSNEATGKRPGKGAVRRRAGFRRLLHENSLSLALAGLFVLSFALHAHGGAAEESRERIVHGAKPVGVLAYAASSRFWFESFQNWQSEFLSVGVLIVLSIFLRQKGSPQSKDVDAPDEQTGD
jgi:hypothetical protein